MTLRRVIHDTFGSLRGGQCFRSRMTLRRVIHDTFGSLRGGQCFRSWMALIRVIHGTFGSLRGSQCFRSRITLRRVIHGTFGSLRDSMNAKVFLVQRTCKQGECWQTATCLVQRGFHPGLDIVPPHSGLKTLCVQGNRGPL